MGEAQAEAVNCTFGLKKKKVVLLRADSSGGSEDPGACLWLAPGLPREGRLRVWSRTAPPKRRQQGGQGDQRERLAQVFLSHLSYRSGDRGPERACVLGCALLGDLRWPPRPSHRLPSCCGFLESPRRCWRDVVYLFADASLALPTGSRLPGPAGSRPPTASSAPKLTPGAQRIQHSQIAG